MRKHTAWPPACSAVVGPSSRNCQRCGALITAAEPPYVRREAAGVSQHRSIAAIRCTGVDRRSKCPGLDSSTTSE